MSVILHEFSDRVDQVGVVERSSIQWDRSMFYNFDIGNRPCPEVIDLTGLSRHVIFGPFTVLEPGLWRAKIEFEICVDAAKRHLVVDFGGDGDFTAEELPFGQPGRKRVTIIHNFVEGVRAEARVYLAKAAFHGYLRFFGATLQRIG